MGMDLGSANFDSSLGGEVDRKTEAYFVFNSDYDSDPDNSQIGGGSDTIEGLLVQASGSYTAKVTIYEKDKCKTTEDYDESEVYGPFDLNDPATGLDHYAVTLSPNSATTCGIIGVTLTAHDASHSAVVTDHSVTLGVSSAGPTWDDTGSATIAKTFSSATVTANLRSSSVVSNVQITLTDTTDGNIGLDSGESPTFGFTGARL